MRRFRVKKPRTLFIVLPVLLLAGILLATVFFAFSQMRGANKNVFRRVNIIVAASPMTVWSWDTKEDSFTMLIIPSQGVVEAVGGYGQYSLEALWKLGFIESRGGALLARSVEDVFGVPIPWYIGEGAGELSQETDAVLYGKRLFSLWSLPKFLLGGFRSNVPIRAFISLSTVLSRVRPDRIRQVDLREGNVTVSETLSDGSVQELFDPDRLEAVLAGVFEDDELRAEAIPVALYNTTAIPALGNRVARLLTTLGTLIVSVGNEHPEIRACELRGREEVLETKTARTISQLLGCERVVTVESQRADLVVLLGASIAARYAKK